MPSARALADQPLHRATLAEIDAESAAAFLLAFFFVELLGRDEAGELDEAGTALLRIVTPIAKATTGKQAAAGVSELIEAFGGAGYVEDTGIPVILRDAQVLPIWEGTTNVLSLDLLLRSELSAGLQALRARVVQAAGNADAQLKDAANSAIAAVDRAVQWHRDTSDRDARLSAAREFTLTLGRALQLALLVEHASGIADARDRASAMAAGLRFHRNGIDRLARL